MKRKCGVRLQIPIHVKRYCGGSRTRESPIQCTLHTTKRELKAHLVTRADRVWPKPRSRNVGSFGNLELYAGTLFLAESEGTITQSTLTSDEKGLGQRLRGLLLVQRVTPTTAGDLITELQAYEWIQRQDTFPRSYSLTPDGVAAAQIAKTDRHGFRRLLLMKMQQRFVVPGWFVDRLHTINPHGGDVVLPGPRPGWRPAVCQLADDKWRESLESEVAISHEHNTATIDNAFPVPLDRWIREVKREWADFKITRSKSTTYAPRGRLARAMRRAAIQLLFNNKPFGCSYHTSDQSMHPVPPRSFQSWCPLLDALELIGYTDAHPDIMGRLIFPCAAFRRTVNAEEFERTEIRSPDAKVLVINQPKWSENMAGVFNNTLWNVYSRFAKKVRTRYISVQDVRDEVCRQLRLSSLLFDTFLEKTVRHTATRKDETGGIMIALESDLQPKQQTGSGLLRRPVYMDGIAHSLISVSVTQ